MENMFHLVCVLGRKALNVWLTLAKEEHADEDGYPYWRQHQTSTQCMVEVAHKTDPTDRITVHLQGTIYYIQVHIY